MQYVVCYSGGHSSALVAIEAVRRYGKENVILLNHNISPKVEHQDIKRFKHEIAVKITGLDITYANMEGWEDKDQFDVCLELGGFKFNDSPFLCTYYMKTEPFYKWLKGMDKAKTTLLYGFDKNEMHRINRRIFELGKDGWITDYPLARWDRTIYGTEEVGIKRPETYKLFKHANCVGCLKSGKQQWYLVYIYYPDIWQKAKMTEESIGYSILKDTFLVELEKLFEQMKELKILPTEHVQSQRYWADVKNKLRNVNNEQFDLFSCEMNMPCDCSF